MTELKDRLREVLAVCTPDRGRFALLAEQSGVAADTWKAFWYGRQRPTSEMLQFVCQRWPEYAFWISTGVTDVQHGHRAPSNAASFEPLTSPREKAAEYFAHQIKMAECRASGGVEQIADQVRLELIAVQREEEERESEEKDRLSDRLEVAQMLDDIDSDTASGRDGFWAQLLIKLQDQRGLTDEQMAKLLKIELTHFIEIKNGNQPLKTVLLKSRLFDALGYDLVRDAVLGLIPTELGARVREFDIGRGRRRLNR